MSDFLAPSIADAPSAFTPESEFDIQAVDRNFRAIQAVEGKWGLPRVPDEVKLDLASMSGIDDRSLTDLLFGIESDLKPAPPEVPIEHDVRPEPTAGGDFRRLAAGIAGQLPPTELSEDATKRFKLEAMERGYLSPDSPIDNTWSPSLNRVRRDMMYDDIDSMYSGDRPGAVTTNQAIDWIGKWTQPSGLLSAATELDLFWDFNAIGDEWSTWGDKWRKVGESTNPLDFAKNFVDAATGPIDDVVFPALNLLLLGTGVGAALNVGRAGVWGTRAGKAALTASRAIYAPSKVTFLQEASWTAQKLQKGTRFAGVGRGLQAWREIPAVARTKQGVQVGMRMGMMSGVQQAFPGYQGGVNLRELSPQVDAGAESLLDFGINSPLSVIPELAFAPQNIFNPGTFMTAVPKFGRGFAAAGGWLPTRAAAGGVAGAAVGAFTGDDTGDVLEGLTYGAVAAGLLPYAKTLPKPVAGALAGGFLGGAVATVWDDLDTMEGAGWGAALLGAATGLSMISNRSTFTKVPNVEKWIGSTTDILARANYRPIADNQQVGMAFQNAMRRNLQGEDLERWDRLMENEGSFVKAFGKLLDGDEDTAATAMTYIMVAAEIDYVALAQAGGNRGEPFLKYRNKLISQLRTFDIESGLLPEDVAMAAAIDRSGGINYRKRYDEILQRIKERPELARQLAEEHNEIAFDTLKRLTEIDNVPLSPALGHAQVWDNVPLEERIGVLEGYIPQMLDTIGDWKAFSGRNLEVENWVVDGLLDGAEVKAITTPWGSKRTPKSGMTKVKSSTEMADDAITDSILRDTAVARKITGKTAPLARTQEGRITVGRITRGDGTPSMWKQDYEYEAFVLQDVREAHEALNTARNKGVLKKLDDIANEGGETLDQLTDDGLKRFIEVNALAPYGKQLRYLRSYLERHGVDYAMLRTHLDERIADIVNDADRWEAIRLRRVVTDQDGKPLEGVAALRAREKELRKQAKLTAAVLDEDSVVESIRVARGEAAAQEMADRLSIMREDGYQLVHGVEFMMVSDLANATPAFADHGIRELNYQTFGNFFGRKQPAVARALQERRELAALSKAFSDNKKILGDYKPDDDSLKTIMRDLRGILLEIQDPIARRGAERKMLNFGEKFRNTLDSAFAPIRVEDLNRNRLKVYDGLAALGYTEDQAKVIFSAIRQMRNTEFQDMGLYALEAKFRRANLKVSALKWLGKPDSGFFSPTRIGMAGGAYVGREAMADQAGADATESEKFGAQIVGAVAGGVAGALGGRMVGKGIAKIGQKNMAQRLLDAENAPGWQLGDRLVRFRDAMRFSLSPMFDISRYTEGLVLSKTGVPLRHADGSRVILPNLLTPTAVKKRIGEAAFNDYRQEFRAAAKGLGQADVNILDDAGHWFAQIGVMGFNPQEWQIAAFAEMRRAGINMQEAYDAARATHTYGIKGRSAAELSTNFVFFPFSFQKKMLTHATKFLQDDLGRSILLHDALQTYEALDKEYNLNEYWADYIPLFRQLERLNAFAYGISPGRFGGINSQLFESVGRLGIVGLSSAPMNMFMPMAAEIKNEDDWLELERLVKQLTPALNDINWMVEEAKGWPSYAATGKPPRVQIREAYREWNDYRNEVQSELDASGMTWSDLHRQPFAASMKFEYERKLAEMQRRYPEWVKQRQESIFNIQALEMERNDAIRQVETSPETATAQAQMLYNFEQYLAGVKEYLSYMGVSVDGNNGWLDAPPNVMDEVITTAVRYAEQDPRFKGVWHKFYEKEIGLIEAKI